MQQVVASIAAGLEDRSWKTLTVYPFGPQTSETCGWWTSRRVAAEPHRAMRDINEPHGVRDMLRLRDLVAGSNVSIVNLHYGGNYISLKDVAAVLLARRRCIVNVHNSWPWTLVDTRKRYMTALAGHLAEKVVAVSDAVGNRLRESGVPASRIRVIPNGVRPPDRPASRTDARQRLNILADDFVIASTCRLSAEKEVARLVEAASLIQESHRRVVVVIAGDGPERAELERLARVVLEGRARFLGWLDDPSDVYAAADLFVLPSALEGMPLAVIEASLRGLPIVATPAGGTLEVVKHDDSALIVPVHDTAGLMRAMQRLYDEPLLRERLGNAALARASGNFTESRMVEQYVELFLN